mmetsp:Transcript_41708/g.87313  ORF Transcript_41708/g.87313 Transcript_41708/m.87313 type:complete len:435 (-) Transcript_41708:606-1910(-)
MQQRQLLAAAAGVASVGAFWLWRRRRLSKRRELEELQASEQLSTESDELCAICLDTPTFPCRTHCGHSFCVDCIITWWRRQTSVLDGRHSGLARCPLCSADVAQLSACFRPASAWRQYHLVLLYNRGSDIRYFAQQIILAVDSARGLALYASLTAYTMAGFAWEAARVATLGSFAPVPPPMDERLRYCGAWVFITSCSGLMRPANWRRLWQPHSVSHFLSETVLRLASYPGCGDQRHALLTLDDAAPILALRALRCQGFYLSLLRLGLSLCQPLIQERLPDFVGEVLPLAAHLLYLAQGAVDLAASILQLRVEVAGLRGLLLLIEWSRRQRVQVCDVSPFSSSEVASWMPWSLVTRRYCDVDLVFERAPCVRINLPWEETLRDFAAPLRVLKVFSGDGLLDRWPDTPWAVADVLKVPPLTLSSVVPMIAAPKPP